MTREITRRAPLYPTACVASATPPSLLTHPVKMKRKFSVHSLEGDTVETLEGVSSRGGVVVNVFRCCRWIDTDKQGSICQRLKF